MTKEALKDIIERYYNGETSLDEEKVLLQYYNETHKTGEPNAQLEQFLYFRSIKNESIGQGFTEKLRSLTLPEKKARRIKLSLIMRIAAMLLVGISITWFVLFKQNEDVLHRITTLAGEQTDITLPDGSKVWLNERSNLTYSNSFGSKNREVYLEGEAYFEVMSNALKPFIIHTKKVTTEVIGTSFNLRSYSEEPYIELNVITGKVTFGAEAKVEVIQGKQAAFSNRKGDIKIIESIDPNAIAWKTKQLIFEDALMQKVINDMERYFNVPIEVETPGMLNCHLSARFNDPELEEVLKVLVYGLNIEYLLKDSKYYIKGQNCLVK